MTKWGRLARRSGAHAVALAMDRDQLVGRVRVHREGLDRLRTEQRRARLKIADLRVAITIASGQTSSLGSIR
jgi:hypothetical protein